MADEWGECVCGECSKPVDEFGSRQFGQSQLSLIQEIMRGIWSRHPRARFSFTLGYDEHKSDPAFYEVVRQMSDPRIEWMEARGRWEFSGPARWGGISNPAPASLPACCFSKQVMRWAQWYNLPIERMVADANRAASAGFYGMITSFEPGFASGSFYREIPFPTHLLPYALTAFAYREMTWNPSLTLDELKERVLWRFFGEGASKELAEDLWALREFIREVSAKQQFTQEETALVQKVERDIRQAEPLANPKALDGIALMRRAIEDARKQAGTP
jgi:hypothetical protein